MALGEFRLFQFKSKKTIREENRVYADWAFPYGDNQKENLLELISKLNPKLPQKLALVSFLTCKELYENALEKSESSDAAVENMLLVLKGYNELIKKKEMPFFLALVIADTKVDMSCEYPPAEDVQKLIDEFEAIKRDSKKPKSKT
ncbi:MAG: hypothetical protein FWD38_01920 [Oscillospiraceae bacterium]|nr:hypothetical protein [Oscillospiraceae bacterium]